jgi:hypothetical protein
MSLPATVGAGAENRKEGSKRLVLTSGLLLGIIIWLYFETMWKQELHVPDKALARRETKEQLRSHGVHKTGDKVMIIARWKEDSSWVDTYFNDVPHVVITPKLPMSTHTTPKNRGNEAGPFLHYIIENYHRLPAHMAFIHGHRISHHTYQLDIVPAMKTVRWGLMGYIPLNVHMYQRVDSEKPEYEDMALVWPKLFTDLAPQIPPVLLSWCCAQFIVTRAAVQARPKEFYEKIYDWVTNEGEWKGKKNVTSFISSRVLEQTWHMIFGMPAMSEMIPPCDIFDCDLLDVLTREIETWEGTPFDRISCKVYETQYLEDKRNRVSPTIGPMGDRLVARFPSKEELLVAGVERQLLEENLEHIKDRDDAMRESGELRAAMKEENTDVTMLQTGYGRPDPPPIYTEPWKP